MRSAVGNKKKSSLEGTSIITPMENQRNRRETKDYEILDDELEIDEEEISGNEKDTSNQDINHREMINTESDLKSIQDKRNSIPHTIL